MSLELTFRQIQKNKFLQDKKILCLFSASLALNIIIWLLIYIIFNNINRPIALHYNILFGIDSIGNWYNLFILPLTGLIILIINFVTVFYFYILRKKNLIKLTSIGSLVIQIILLICIILIINI